MNALKRFLTDNHLKQVELASYLGVTPAFVSSIVSSSRRLPPDARDRILHNDRGWDVSALAVTESGPEELDREVAILRERVKYLELLLAEKERAIQILSLHRPSDSIKASEQIENE